MVRARTRVSTAIPRRVYSFDWTGVLPLYLVLGLGLSPFMFGVIDGLYPGVTALVRWFAGALGDRTSRH